MNQLNNLEKYNTSFLLLPLVDNKKLDDLLKYKSKIILLRKSTRLGRTCLVSYVKKSTGEIKEYELALKSYYIRFDNKQTIIYAKDVNDKRRNGVKTFFLDNIENVEITDNKINDEINVILN